MRGPAHAAVTAGVASSVVTLWMRNQVRKQYHPIGPIPSVRQRLHLRRPMALAGLAFTGVASGVSYSFDQLEMDLLGGDIGSHHELHTVRFVGGIFSAAQLLKKGSHQLANWVTRSLGVPDAAKRVMVELRNLANWILDGAFSGVVTHILADLPNSGRGNSALTLLKPFSNRSFDLGWWVHANPVVNDYAMKAGLTLSAASWLASGMYLSAGKPPENSLPEAIDTLRSFEDLEELQEYTFEQLVDVYHQVLDTSPIEFAQSSIFHRNGSTSPWYDFDIDVVRMFDMKLDKSDERFPDITFDEPGTPSY